MKKTIIYGLILGLILFLAFIELSSWNKIYPGVKVANIHLGGLSLPQAQARLEKVIKDFSQVKLSFNTPETKFQPTIQDLGISFDLTKTLNRAFKIGRSNLTLNVKSLFQKAKALLVGYNFPLVVRLDENLFNQFLKENLALIESPAKDASLKILEIDTATTSEVKQDATLEVKRETLYTIRLIPSEEGLEVNQTLLKLELKENLAYLKNNPIEVKLIKSYPKIKNSDLANARMEAYQILETPVSLEYEDQKWKVPTEEIVGWIEFSLSKSDADIKRKSNADLRGIRIEDSREIRLDTLAVSLNQEAIKDFITPLAPEINSEPINAQFSLKNGKVTAFSLSREGKRLDLEESAVKIADALITGIANFSSRSNDDNRGLKSATPQSKSATIELIVSTLTPEITTESINNLGITTLIGKGESNFAGSPKNRVYNIKLSAAKFNGILIKPGEEFSFNEILGEVGPNEGYLPELVIKRNKIILEFGGGICQVSTTVFRAALFSGLPITERFPHSFAVSYYDPPGMDATVYPPHPDLRFKNDTPGHILIQRKIIGNKLTFELFGTNKITSEVKQDAQTPGVNDNQTPGVDDVKRSVKIKGPYIIEKKGDGSMKTVLYREIYHDQELVKKETFWSSYASPDKYPISE